MQVKRGTAEKWTELNPILEDGQFGFERPINSESEDYFKLKIGDGKTPWNDLPYIGSSELASILNRLSSLEDRVSILEEGADMS